MGMVTNIWFGGPNGPRRIEETEEFHEAMKRAFAEECAAQEWARLQSLAVTSNNFVKAMREAIDGYN